MVQRNRRIDGSRISPAPLPVATISPTSSPTRVLQRHDAELAGLEASRRSSSARAGRVARCAPSSTLSATPSPSGPGRAEQPSAPPFAVQPSSSRISSVSAARAADQLRMGPHRRRHACAAVELLEPREHRAPSAQRHRERRDAAAVDRGRQRVRRQRPPSAISCQARALHRVRRQPVAAARPALRAADREHPGVLARAVVLDRRGRLERPALELVLGRRAPSRAGSARRRAARAGRGATPTRSRPPRRSGRRGPARAAAPGTASRRSGGTRPGRVARLRHDRAVSAPRPRARGDAPPRRRRGGRSRRSRPSRESTRAGALTMGGNGRMVGNCGPFCGTRLRGGRHARASPRRRSSCARRRGTGRIVGLLRERAASTRSSPGARDAEGHGRPPREGARASRPRASRAHAACARRHREVLRPRRAALPDQERGRARRRARVRRRRDVNSATPRRTRRHVGGRDARPRRASASTRRR